MNIKQDIINRVRNGLTTSFDYEVLKATWNPHIAVVSFKPIAIQSGMDKDEIIYEGKLVESCCELLEYAFLDCDRKVYQYGTRSYGPVVMVSGFEMKNCSYCGAMIVGVVENGQD